MKKTAVITGASSGIGKSIAERFAKEGYRLVICGRNETALSQLEEELSKQTEVYTLSFDVRDKAAVFEQIQQLPSPFGQIDILINNAGNAHGLDLIQDGNIDDWDAMFDINVKGLLYVSKAILPQMIERRDGHIIHIGSTAAKDVYPKGNVYCASKSAVDTLNEAFRLDLNGTGVKVGAVHPGMVRTAFSEVRFKGDVERADSMYVGYQPLFPEDVADIVHFVVSRPYHVNIADLVVFCTDQASSTIINKKF
jgi:NADP-dependent 3-hydroxy acid dehydrogenase YdfG